MDENTNNDLVDSGNLDQIEEALNDLSDKVETQSDSNEALLKEIKKINEYNAKQAKLQAEEKQAAETKAKQEEQARVEADQEAAEQAELDAQVQAEKEASAQDHVETQEEILVDIRTQLELQNELHIVTIISFGIVCGLLFIKILVDRLIKL